MNVFARGMVVLGSGFWGVASFVASAQLASTQLDGLQINCTGIYLSGDSRDLDCSIGLEFTGQKADHAVRVSRVKIIRAEDDTGMDLVRTNKNFSPGSDSPGSDGGLFQMIRGLKSPAPKAKAIRQLEAEAPVVGRMTSGRFRVYRFKTLPPPGTQLVLYLAVPESLKHIPFSIKNIPLNQPAGSFHIK
jgi:hypothetical protein